jgi:NAD(P)-dependent dehydrogenase (short-subunit alcohol dehydrogenase family)
MMGRLTGKIGIVTGATSGIGRGCALAMVEAGAKLVVTGRNVERGHMTVDMIDGLGGESVFVQQDVTSEADWQRVMDTTLERFGRLDVLLNNAGDARLGPLTELTLDTLQFLLRVDLEGPFIGMKLAWPHLIAAGGGAIINMSSVAGQRGVAGGTAYCSVKGAQAALTRAAAMEGAPVNIRVNSMHPGLIWTEGVTDVMGDNVAEFKPRLLAHVPWGAFGEPQNVADACVYLASDEARHVTGIELNVDGGQLAR